MVAQVHLFKLESWEQERFQTEVFINHQTQTSGNPGISSTTWKSSFFVQCFFLSFWVCICTAPSMLACRNTLVITRQESWHTEGIMKREETILAGSFFILHQFLMSGQLRVQGWGSRKWREKKKQMKIPQPQQQKPQTNQENSSMSRDCLLLSWRACFHTHLSLVSQTHVASEAEILVPYSENRVSWALVIFSSLSKVSTLMKKEIRRQTDSMGTEICYHLLHSDYPDRMSRNEAGINWPRLPL